MDGNILLGQLCYYLETMNIRGKSACPKSNMLRPALESGQIKCTGVYLYISRSFDKGTPNRIKMLISTAHD